MKSKLEKIWLKWVYASSWHKAEGTNTFLPPACHTLFRKKKIDLCECLSGIKVPGGYSSNIPNLVSMKNLKLVGLRSHDCHALIQ